MSVRLRFVDTADNIVSRVIRQAEMGASWSHVEAVTPEGDYLGSLTAGGVALRDASYDTTWARQLFVDVPCTAEQETAFYTFLTSKIGLPYDHVAILEMLAGVATGEAPDWKHAPSYICSALQTAALLHAGIIKSAPLTVRLATPRDVLSGCGYLVAVGEPESNKAAA